jgi:hypothetical protein
MTTLQRESDILSRTWAELLKAGPERIWGLCDETSREIWCIFAKQSLNNATTPWDKLGFETQRNLTRTLLMMTNFFIDLDRARRAVNS